MIHDRLANTVLLYIAILALWALWRFVRRQGVDSSYWGALVIAEILILMQGALGIILLLGGANPARGGVHILYGIVSALSIPAVYVFTKGRDERRDILIYGAVLLFNSGIALRAIATGG
jgi:heme A synthase